MFGSLLQGLRRTPGPPQFWMLPGQPFMASGVSEVQLLSHSPFGAWPCVSGAQRGWFAGAMDVPQE